MYTDMYRYIYIYKHCNRLQQHKPHQAAYIFANTECKRKIYIFANTECKQKKRYVQTHTFTYVRKHRLRRYTNRTRRHAHIYLCKHRLPKRKRYIFVNTKAKKKTICTGSYVYICEHRLRHYTIEPHQATHTDISLQIQNAKERYTYIICKYRLQTEREDVHRNIFSTNRTRRHAPYRCTTNAKLSTPHQAARTHTTRDRTRRHAVEQTHHRGAQPTVSERRQLAPRRTCNRGRYHNPPPWPPKPNIGGANGSNRTAVLSRVQSHQTRSLMMRASDGLPSRRQP
jgi:hypothetical protein